MHKIIRVALTAAVLVAIAWPLLFWGQPASPGQDRGHVDAFQGRLIFNTTSRPELYW